MEVRVLLRNAAEYIEHTSQLLDTAVFCYYKEAIKLATSVGVGYYKVINNLTKGVL
jgi:hypothetical protein